LKNCWRKRVKRPAVFLDRDGTINEEMGYINHLSRFKIFETAFEAVRLLNQHNFYVFVVTNQSGPARGYTPVDFVHQVHSLMKNEFSKRGAIIDDIFVCLHRKDAIIPELRQECNCRKPKTGLVEQAILRYEIDIKQSFMVGDRLVDIEVAKRMDMRSALVKTGYGLGEIEFCLQNSLVKPDFIAEDILDAANWILKKNESPHS
jgi:D-glycero-D-manno-heptose 1,7-bisphosphate phosphatase